MATDLNAELSKKTAIFGLKFWEIIAKRSRARNKVPLTKIPSISKEIKEVRVEQVSTTHFVPHDGILLTIHDKSSDKDSDKVMVHLGTEKSRNGGDNTSRSGSFHRFEKMVQGLNQLACLNSLTWLGSLVHIEDLELATNRFSKENVLGERGHGVVYRGKLSMGRLWLGQAEKEFRVEVEAIRHVRHKNLDVGLRVRHNGNLEQWLHGAMRQHRYLTWEARIKILLGTAKALTYLHEAIEPKVVHRDIKSSNILIDDDFNAKVSDFGLAKLLGAGKVMLQPEYVAPEYANTGLLNERVMSIALEFVLLEAITGRDPWITAVLPRDWLKMIVGNKRSEEVVDPNIEVRPSTRALKRALLTALRCVDPDSEKRPKMGQVARMLESEEYPIPRETEGIVGLMEQHGNRFTKGELRYR
ncbi:putative receptor-like protein kinase [Hibiscus syriacus]|uniref:non-specific serine/threonine protein kinase n=1 Tax=Hibiscus syriacus TaxID=106335 RepID=A0A6A3BYI3_HIBSY|nr:putative receptor-like protein kinase [Hibiscus syriacus]